MLWLPWIQKDRRHAYQMQATTVCSHTGADHWQLIWHHCHTYICVQIQIHAMCFSPTHLLLPMWALSSTQLSATSKERLALIRTCDWSLSPENNHYYSVTMTTHSPLSSWLPWLPGGGATVQQSTVILSNNGTEWLKSIAIISMSSEGKSFYSNLAREIDQQYKHVQDSYMYNTHRRTDIHTNWQQTYTQTDTQTDLFQ